MLKIMPMGDSITEGVQDITNPLFASNTGFDTAHINLNPGPILPYCTTNNGYRKMLYDMIRGTGQSIEFVGSIQCGDFAQMRHEGRASWSMGNMLGGISLWLQNSRPDVILLHAGTNDAIGKADSATMKNRLRDLLQTILTHAATPQVFVLLARIPRVRASNEMSAADAAAINRAIDDFNTLQIDRALSELGNLAARVDVVDMRAVEISRDGVHPTAAGYQTMATRWYAAFTHHNVQAESKFTLGDQLTQSVWRWNKGYVRSVPIINGAHEWQSAGAWSSVADLSALADPRHPIEAQTEHIIGNTLTMSVWQNGQGYFRDVLIQNNQPQWGTGSWSSPIAPDPAFSGAGNVQAHSAFVIADQLTQSVWRNNVGCGRVYSIMNGSVNWSPISQFDGVSADAISGDGEIQDQSEIVIGNTLWQYVWRGNVGYSRRVLIVNGAPDWSSATAWATISITDLP
jgi:lysophospholipase L1-like esterase